MDVDIAAYCARIGVSGALPPTAATLRRLHRAHMLAVPFENLDIHWGRPIVLEEARLFEKLVTQAAADSATSRTACLRWCCAHSASRSTCWRRAWARNPGRTASQGPPYVAGHNEGTVAGGRGLWRRFPRAAVAGRGGAASARGWRLARGNTTAVRACIRAARQPKLEARVSLPAAATKTGDFTPGCEHHQHSPESHFTQKRVCSLATETGRITLSDLCLIETEGFPSRRPPPALNQETSGAGNGTWRTRRSFCSCCGSGSESRRYERIDHCGRPGARRAA